EVVAKYVSPVAQEGDIVVMAESVVAITQRRYLIPDEHVKPGFWASRLCYLIPSVGSLSSRYGMQSAIDEIGLPRMLTGVGVGAAMKLLGRPGWLYRIAGMPSELVDDISGTMPPYDKYIVLGPAHAQSVVNEVKARTGLEAAIADVNNLRRAAILAATKGVDVKGLIAALLSNPLGNAAEQTPIVVVRPVPVPVESESHA
ncbi:MAG: F420-0:Gamma-glutamyl ligase, partial [Candidatus Melainabacteria bacterium HGW-Melainabacteria-1]